MAKNKTTRKSAPEQDPPDSQEVQSETEPVPAEMTSVEESSEQTPEQRQPAPAGQDEQTPSFLMDL